MRSLLTRALAALVTMLLLAAAAQANAGSPQRRLVSYGHSRWTATEGAPPIIYAIAQDTRGYLILGSSVGLYRFDGLTFEAVASRDPQIAQDRILFLFRAQDDTIWVCYDNGVIATYRDGVLRQDRTVPSTSPEPTGIAQTRDGSLWVLQTGRDRPFLRRRNGAWERINIDYGNDDPTAPLDITATSDGTLWMSTGKYLYALRENGARFTRIAKAHGRTKISEDQTGRVWLSDDEGTRPLQPSQPSLATYPTAPFRLWTAVTRFDRDGNLWIANGEALFRVGNLAENFSRTPSERRSMVESMRAKDGLTADTTTPLFEDREGTIWVGTTRGLDQFRKVNIIREPVLSASTRRGIGLLAARDGSVYFGINDAVYRALPNGQPKLVIEHIKDPSAICEAAGSEIVVLAAGAQISINGREIQKRPAPSLFEAEGSNYVHGCALNTDGTLWVARDKSNATIGLYSYRMGKWDEVPLPPDQTPLTISQANDGTPLVLLASGTAGLLNPHGKVTTPLVTRAAFKRRSINLTRLDRFVWSTSHGIILAGDYGLARINNTELQFADLTRFPWLSGPTEIVETPQGETWMIGRVGIVRMNTLEFARTFSDSRSRLSATIFDFDDGLPEVRSLTSQRGGVRGGDGRLWFSTVAGVVWMDPTKLVRNNVAPPVHIRGLTAGTIHYPDPIQGLELPKGMASVSISYAGLSLAVPHRVRFRYRLEGVDGEWIDAGGRREAFYTNLEPGTYRFRVIASNNDGVWNREGAALEFTIAPTFLQSIWFKLLCGLALAFTLFALVRFRIRVVHARLQAHFDVRTAERERIARELHDTLLQGVQGLTYVVQAAAGRLPADNEPRKSIEEALDRAEKIIGEGRDRVLSLRTEAEAPSLSAAIERAASSILVTNSPTFQLQVDGQERLLLPGTSLEVVHIAEEALRNAARHARASAIHVRLVFGTEELRLEVNDDGKGFDEEVTDAGGRPGRYGLMGMRERATQIEGRLEIETGPMVGTLIRLTIPARHAYQASHSVLVARLRELWSGRRKAHREEQ